MKQPIEDQGFVVAKGDGSQEYRERSRHEASAWRAVFRRVDPALNRFAKQHRLGIIRWHGDAPDRVLTWNDSPAKSIRILVDGQPTNYYLLVGCSAWNRHRVFPQVHVNEYRRWDGKDQLREIVSQTLNQAYSQVMQWQGTGQ